VTEKAASVGLSGVAAVLPPRSYSLDELAAAGLLYSSPSTLAGLGFERAYVCDSDSRPEQMALDAARAALDDAGLGPHDIDVVIWASARGESHVVRPDAAARLSQPDVLAGFRYSSAWLQQQLDLRNADVMAVAQQGCSTMFSAVRLARTLLVAESRRCEHVLCVGLDVLPAGAPREILYNVISDGACAVIVSRGYSADVWRGYRQISRGHYSDAAACGPEIIAAYFPIAKALIEQLLREHGLRSDQVDVVIPTGVSHVSWDVLLRLTGIPSDRLYRGVPPFGHTMTSDTFVFLSALRRAAHVPRGSRLLLFTYGFGSSWCGLLLEH
jgi:3-oxoacyl-[acyl-carrier-protein] synthase-3